MNKNLLIGLITIGTSIGATAQCVTNTANIYSFNYNGDSYEIVKENLNWLDASACAVERGGILTEINSQEEQDSVFHHVNNAGISASSTIAPDGGGASYLWLGGNDLLTEGEWVWNGNYDTSYVQFWQGKANGNPVNGLFNNWGNEPDDYGNGQDALGLAFTNWPLGNAGQWNDVNDQNSLYYIIEYKSTPLSVSSLNEVNELLVYPNPSTGMLNISFGTEMVNNTQIQILNITGELVRTLTVDGHQENIVVNGLENGMYFVKLIQDEKLIQVTKVVMSK